MSEAPVILSEAPVILSEAPVILSEAKDLGLKSEIPRFAQDDNEILRFAQDDNADSIGKQNNVGDPSGATWVIRVGRITAVPSCRTHDSPAPYLSRFLMRSILRYLSLGVLAVVMNACERPTGPTSSPATALAVARPNASISDAVNGGRLGFYFLPALVPNPGAFPGTFDGTLAPYVNICALVDQAVGCGDGEMLVTLASGGDKPGGISVDASSETYNANWNKPTLDVGKYRVYVHVNVPVPQTTIIRQVGLGFIDLQVVSKKKDPVDPGFVGAVKGAPIPVKFRIETNTVAAIVETNRVGPRIIPVGRVGFIATAVFDLKGTIITCPTMTWTSSDPAVATVANGSQPTTGVVTGIAVGRATITATCRGVSEPIVVRITEPN